MKLHVMLKELVSAYQREWLWHITVIPCPLVVCLICTPSALGPAGFGCTYQANHSCPWYNYNIHTYNKAPLRVLYDKIQHEAKPSAVIVMRLHPECCILSYSMSSYTVLLY